MSPRLSLMVAGLGFFASVARAQTAPPALGLPAPPLTFPIAPAPLDEKAQAVPDVNTVRGFAVALKYIKPSVMAYWLDPKNHERPSSAPGVILAPPPADFVWPKGLDRIVAVDPQNVLLIFGTEQGAAKTKDAVALLDKPQIGLVVNDARVGFDASLYWIDSLAPATQRWQQAAPAPRNARPGELEALEALEALKAQDRANLQMLPPIAASNAYGTSLSLPYLESSRNTNTRNFNSNQDSYYSAPHVYLDPDIDPGIQALRSNPRTVGRQSELLLLPREVTADSLELLIADFGSLRFPATNLALHDGDTFLLSGDVAEKKLRAPSPRFDTFVLAVKIHIFPPATLAPVPEPAK